MSRVPGLFSYLTLLVCGVATIVMDIFGASVSDTQKTGAFIMVSASLIISVIRDIEKQRRKTSHPEVCGGWWKL